MKKFSIYCIGFLMISLAACKKKETPAPAAKVPVASFSATIDNFTVQMANKSTDATTYEWDFGDTTTSTESAPKHTYKYEGHFTIKLTAKSSAGTNSSTQSVSVGKMEKLISLKTQFGEMIIWLYDETPKHKANFLKLSDSGFYNDLQFHRVIPGFMVQGGDPNSKDEDFSDDGQGGPGYTIPKEFVSSLKHDYGAVAAARLSDAVNPSKASSGSQFYIVDTTSGAHFLDNNYTVFGKVIKGVEQSNMIAHQNRDASDHPLTAIRMKVSTISVTRYDILSLYGYKVK